jgi:hypothetical protein
VQFRRIGDDRRSLHPVAICRPRPEFFCEAGYESLGESLPIGRQVFEGDSPRNRAVTKNSFDFPARGQIQPIGQEGSIRSLLNLSYFGPLPSAPGRQDRRAIVEERIRPTLLPTTPKVNV